MSKIIKFIEDNRLDFTSEGSGLNSNCTIISGYALHTGVESFEELCDELAGYILSNEAWDELERVFNYAYENGYERYWTTKDAKQRYVF